MIRSILFYRRFFSFFMILLLLVYTTGCNYYTAKRYPYSKIDSRLEKIEEEEKYYLVHYGEEVYALENIVIGKSFISGELVVPVLDYYYIKDGPKKFKDDEASILQEVHFYLDSNVEELSLGEIQIPYDNIIEMHVIKNDNAPIVIVLGVILIVGVISGIIMATNSGPSCPYIYVNNGTEFVFQGEAFPGALYSNLERDDYMPLPGIQSTNDQYRLRISNELEEIHYTDLAELVVVNHEPGTKVLLDQNGTIHTIGQLHPVIHARTMNDQDLTEVFATTDRQWYSFSEPSEAVNAAYLTFYNPGESETGKLVIQAKNSYWLGYLTDRFYAYSGEAFERVVALQEKFSPEDRLEKIQGQHIPLSVYQRVGEDWQLVDHINTVGPIMDRELVIPIDLSSNPDGLVELKLETGFSFWDIDYVGMDFSEPAPAEITQLPPTQAFGTGGIDWRDALSSVDQNYMVHENSGEVTDLIYPAVPYGPEEAQTVFLHTRGYYELIRNFEGPPQVKELKKFQEPGHLAEFSVEEYLRVLSEELELAEVDED